MTVVFGAKKYAELTSLKELAKLLEELSLSGKYKAGPDELIEYNLDGDLTFNGIDDEDCSAMLQILDEHGAFITWFSIMGSYVYAPPRSKCESMLAELDYDYQSLWKWMLETVTKEAAQCLN